MGYAVSFCIPEHNECDLVHELVQNLLKNPNPHFQVVVSDNMTDNTDPWEIYRDIHDSRFKLVQQEKAVSRQENWRCVLEQGEGEYLYLVMGRDWLNGRSIGKLLPLLERAREDRSDVLIDRKSEEDYRLYRGVDALIHFITYEHPTGFIVSKKAFSGNERKKQYYRHGVIYPEMYIKRDVIASGAGIAAISSGVFANLPTRQSLGKRLSGCDPYFNYALIKDLYFSPEQAISVFREEIDMVFDDPRFHLSESEKEAYSEKKYQELLRRAVFENKWSVESEEYMKHYGMLQHYVPLRTMIGNLSRTTMETYRMLNGRSLKRDALFLRSFCRAFMKITTGEGW